MKQFFLTIAIVVGSTACTESHLTEKRPNLPVIDHPERVEIRKSFKDIPVNNLGFCTDPTGKGCMQTYRLLMAQLMVLDPIPVPQPGTGQIISTSEAVDRYKAFVAQYTGEPILAMFKQLYPRILLNKYGILNGTNYDQIAYFTQQLVEAKSFDSATLTIALKKLKPNLEPGKFNTMRAAAQQAARQQKSLIEKEIAALSDTTAAGPYGDEMSDLLFPKEIRAHFLAEKERDYSAVLNNLDELNRL